MTKRLGRTRAVRDQDSGIEKEPLVQVNIQELINEGIAAAVSGLATAIVTREVLKNGVKDNNR